MAPTSAPISQIELLAILEGGQSARVAFHRTKSKPMAVAETLIAMANGDGGYVLLGVNASGSIMADNEPDILTQTVDNARLLSEPTLNLSSPKTYSIEERTILLVYVPPDLSRVFHLNGTYLIRDGDRNRPLTTGELRRLMLERGDFGYESRIVPQATLDDLDMDQIQRYLKRLTFVSEEDVTAALSSRGCIAYDLESQAVGDTDINDEVINNDVEISINSGASPLRPTVAGMLLFGRNPQQFIRSAEVICVRYTGDSMSDEFVRQDVGGSLSAQIRQAEAFVLSNMRRDVRISGIERDDTAEYPVAVVREAVVNAIAHRDYAVRGEGIRLFMFSDRLEVYSPGRLPGHVTIDNLVDERYSRNEALVSVLSDMGYIERLGYGIDRMIAVMEASGMLAPEFEETAAGFKVTLRSAAVRTELMSASELRKAGVRLNQRQEGALVYVREHGRITNSEYQQLEPHVSAETIRRDLSDLVAKNVLLRIGEKRATYYILK